MPYHRALFFIHSKCNICIYTLNSQSIPLFLPPSLSATMSLISMSVSLFLFPRQIQYCHILDSMYRRYHMVFLFLTYFTQYDNLYVHPCCGKWHYFILFNEDKCHDIAYMWNLKKTDTKEVIYKIETNPQTENKLWLPKGKVGKG